MIKLLKHMTILSLFLAFGCSESRINKKVNENNGGSVSMNGSELVSVALGGEVSQPNPAILNSDPHVFGVVSTMDLVTKATSFAVDSFVIVSDDYVEQNVLWRAVRKN